MHGRRLGRVHSLDSIAPGSRDSDGRLKMTERQGKLGDKAKAFARKAHKTASSKVRAAADFSGDGKVDAKDVGIAAAWTRKKATVVGKKAHDLTKSALRTDLGKDAATGAGIGAVAGVAVPVVGPLAGAAIGAGVGIYRNRKKKRSSSK